MVLGEPRNKADKFLVPTDLPTEAEENDLKESEEPTAQGRAAAEH